MELDYPDENGVTHRSRLEHQETQYGIPQTGLDVLVPFDARHLWDIFWELNASRGNSGFGLSPISYLEIEAWSRVQHTHLSSWDLAVLRQMDVAFLQTAAEMQKRYTPKTKQTIGRK